MLITKKGHALEGSWPFQSGLQRSAPALCLSAGAARSLASRWGTRWSFLGPSYVSLGRGLSGATALRLGHHLTLRCRASGLTVYRNAAGSAIRRSDRSPPLCLTVGKRTRGRLPVLRAGPCASCPRDVPLHRTLRPCRRPARAYAIRVRPGLKVVALRGNIADPLPGCRILRSRVLRRGQRLCASAMHAPRLLAGTGLFVRVYVPRTRASLRARR